MFNKGPNYANATARIADQAKVAEGLVASDLDTGDQYLRTLSGWLQCGTGGSEHTYQTGGLWDYGPPREDGYLSASAVLPGASAAGSTVFQTTDVQSYNGMVIDVVAIGGTGAKLQAFPLIDGAVYSTSAIGWKNLITGALIDGVTGLAGTGLYAMYAPGDAKTKYKSIRLVQNGGAADQSCTVRYAHVWA